MNTNEKNAVENVETTDTAEVKATTETPATETPATVLSITRKYIRKAVEENLKNQPANENEIPVRKRDLDEPDVKELVDTLVEDLFKTAVEEAYKITEKNDSAYTMLVEYIREKKAAVIAEKEKAKADEKEAKVAIKAAKKAEKEAAKPKKNKTPEAPAAESTTETEVKA
jgi:hypothetical protein